MSIQVTEQISSKKRYYSGTNPVNFITIHETANEGSGADAQAHANLQSRGNVRLASWHYSVDDHSVFQSYEDKRQCWHAGDGRGNGNAASVGIEICENRDGDYKQSVRNAALLTAQLLKKHGLNITDVKQHNNWSGKDCPNDLRKDGKGYSWPEFLTLVVDAADGKLGNLEKPTIKPDTDDLANQKTDVDGWWGTDVTIELQYIFDTPIDGEVWRQNSVWKSANPGLTWGWKWESKNTGGSPLIYAMQDWLGSDYKGGRDGDIGPEFIKGLQRRLKRMGYYKGEIDGELWKESATIKGLQRAINDGKIK